MAVSNKKSAAASKKNAPQTSKLGLIDTFRGGKKICQIYPTNSKPKSDIFETMRPEPYTTLDYDISETDLKLDAGETKIHLQQTRAKYDYPPPGVDIYNPNPVKKKKIIYSHAGPPVWKFVDEIWREEREKLQKYYLGILKKKKRARLRAERLKFSGDHERLQKLCGPVWFQELSPKQLKVIDSLHRNILRDLKRKTIEFTSEVMAGLGLVLRPNHRHIEKALLHCCTCPVEFLLILYQLINPTRENYTLNDKLLLSAVVHLTLRDTLREMHIRFPSPPKKQKKPKKPKKKPKVKHYPSPYLQPNTFKPKPRRHGIYENTKRQYPESPYFSYIKELKKLPPPDEIDVDDASLNEADQEIFEEWEAAQETYNELIKGANAPRLHKPSIYRPCNQAFQNILGDQEDRESVKPKKKEQEVDNEKKKNIGLSVAVDITTDYDENAEPINKRCQCTIIFEENYDEQSALTYNIDSEETDREIQVEEHEDKSCGKSMEELFPPQLPAKLPLKPLDKPVSPKTRTVAVKPRTPTQPQAPSKKNDFSLVVKSPIELSTTYEDITIPELEKSSTPVTVKRPKSSECMCKAEVKKMQEERECQCDKCVAMRFENMKRTLVMEGTKIITIPEEDEGEGEEEEESKKEAVPIISSVRQPETCDCLKKYWDKIRRYEAFKKRFESQLVLKEDEQKFVIGGVYRDKDGTPRYIITGVKPRHECECVQKMQEIEDKENERIANLPQIPHGPLKYIISDVKKTPHGNSYVVSGVVPIEDCECMRLFKRYSKMHKTCWEAFQQYMEKVRVDIDQYMYELFEREQELAAQMGENEGESYDINFANIKTPRLEAKEEESVSENTQGQDDSSKNTEEKSKSPRSSTGKNQDEEKDEETYNQPPPTPISNSEVCTCGPRRPSDEYIETNLQLTLEINKDKEQDKKKKRKGANVDMDLKRFVILKKIPCDPTEQKQILKHLLSQLAEDGYPLAKLPDAHKLPIFKLWMLKRCGHYWPQIDRYKKFGAFTRKLWNHTDVCQQKHPLPSFPFSCAEGDKYTWAHSAIVKQMIKIMNDNFNRLTKQACIRDGREYFPTMCDYEFPTENFRHTYFAYVPAKEEDVFAFRPWHPHEIKNARNK